MSNVSNRYYFTFGVGQPYRQHYVLVLAESREMARSMMNDAHGDKWAFAYDLHQWMKTSMADTYKELSSLHHADDDVDWSHR